MTCNKDVTIFKKLYANFWSNLGGSPKLQFGSRSK